MLYHKYIYNLFRCLTCCLKVVCTNYATNINITVLVFVKCGGLMPVSTHLYWPSSLNDNSREFIYVVPSMTTMSLCLTKTHYIDVIMGAMVSQITSLTIVYSTVYSGADQRKHQNYAALAFVREIHRWPVNSPHKWPVTRKIFPFDDVIMSRELLICLFWIWVLMCDNNKY